MDTLKMDNLSIGNTSEPTIDFQGTFVSFPGSYRIWNRLTPFFSLGGAGGEFFGPQNEGESLSFGLF